MLVFYFDRQDYQPLSCVCVCVGGLGEAVAGALSEEVNIRIRRLAVTGIPRSGLCHELLEIYGISSAHIIKAVKDLIAQGCTC